MMMTLSPTGHNNGPDWPTAAADNPLLVAAELFFISHPTDRVPWRHFLSDPSQPSPPATWGRKRSRSSKPTPDLDHPSSLTARLSPSSPLSWSAGSSERDTASVKVDVDGLKAVVGVGRRRKMTMAELREFERSLLVEQMELRKDLEERRYTKGRLMEENANLRRLQLKIQDEQRKPSMGYSLLATKYENNQFLPFDLNDALPEDSDLMLF